MESIAAEPTPEEEALAAAAKKRRKRMFGAIGCLVVVVLGCCCACGLFVVGARRHDRDVQAYTLPPATDPNDETDPGWRLVAEARVRASRATCEAVADELRTVLVTRPEADVVAFHEWLREHVAAADTQGVRDACFAARYGGCGDVHFLQFRGMLVALGHAAYDRAVADPDSLVDVLPPHPLCDEMTWVALAALREQALDAGVDASSADASVADASVVDASVAGAGIADGGAPDASADVPSSAPTEPDPGTGDEPPPLGTTTGTRRRARTDLHTSVPNVCARFSCGPGDIFEDGFD